MGIISRWRASADRWYLYVMLFYSFVAYSGILVLDRFHLRLTDDTSFKSISPFFGPGVYLAWWFTASSVLMRCPVEEPASGITESDQNLSSQAATDQNLGMKYGADLISATYYVAGVAIWSIYQIFHKNHAELAASLVVLEVGADFCTVHILTIKATAFSRNVALGLLIYSIQAHQAFLSPNHALAAGVNACVFVGFNSLWVCDKWPLKSTPRRLLTGFILGVLWIFNFADFGTYATMPRTEVEFVSLDQLVPLSGAILAITWSWRTELKTFWNKRIRSLRESLGQLGQTLQAWNPNLDRFLRKTTDKIQQIFQRENESGTL
ncbi:uncharacterized protein Bfra_009850 [Botrytis fragariae]|uniref:Uncharacterized protein n=1 Tax=Botrytis fragariae TaxID=1964551 RepID=A0A8H6AN95_9HELO|nr:uncharacterized protein Bfra_009850 [Botrytis fragariae]KAF5870463.1 hypothetical protein Bfra_009850 [Botrytis fragariae]